MKYQHGVLRDERDSTLRLAAMPDGMKLSRMEYLPLLVMIVMISALVMVGYYLLG